MPAPSAPRPRRRQRAARGARRRGLAVCAAAGLALGAAGCGGGPGSGPAGTSGPPLVTGEQVVTACFHTYFYNGILPKAAAQSNCTACVVEHLQKLGIQPVGAETVMDMLTGDRLSSATIQTLQNNCNLTDAGSQ